MSKSLYKQIDIFSILLFSILVIAFAHSLYAFSLGWHNTLLDVSGFRQTQTAISVYWMLKGGHYLAYQTPVVGFPWNIPFEFPLYQWLVLLTFKLTNLGLDQAGRLVSVIFFYLTLLPMYSLLKNLGFESRLFKIFTCLLLFSPTYLFWSRTFLIESVVLFLSATYLALAQAFLTKRKTMTAILCIIIGCLAIITKVTTFVPFSLFCAGLILLNWHKNYGYKINKEVINRYTVTVLFGLIPLIAVIIWTNYADSLNSLNIIGQSLTSRALATFNFGTFQQRISSYLWIHVILERSLSYGIGLGTIVFYSILVIRYFKNPKIKLALFCFAIYLSAYLIFTHLNMYQYHYFYENTIFLVLFAALILYVLLKQNAKILFSILLVTTIILQLAAYHITYYKLAAKFSIKNNSDYLIGNLFRQHTNSNSIILVYGNDYSSAVAYYSKRKAFTDPLTGNYIWRLQHIRQFTGGLPISAVILCPSKIDTDYKAQALLNKLATNFHKTKITNCRVFYKPGKPNRQNLSIKLDT